MATHAPHVSQLHAPAEAPRKVAVERRPLTTNDKRLAAFLVVAATTIVSIVAVMVWANAQYWANF